jgi:alkylation response protein AidB-like acyl-CoA dehydrogenase
VQFEFTSEQRDLAALARQVAADLSGLSAESANPHEIKFPLLVETGLSGLLLPEDMGGSGATVVEAAIVAEELGRSLAPSAITGSFLIAPAALEMVVDPILRSEIAEGIVAGRPCSVVVDADLSWPPRGGPGLAWAWHPDALVLTPQREGLTATQAAEYKEQSTEDLSLRLGVAGPSVTDIVESDSGQRFLAMANVVTSCLLLGHMRATLDLAVAYALEREQFGAKIGSFQAIKHLCADMLVDAESSHSIAYGAAAIVAHASDVRSATRAAAVAKAWCGDAAIRVCEGAIQVHGGIGFTWEFPLHRYLRASHAARVSFMSPADALDLITRLDRWT